jgi:hypothetical protein
MPVERATLRAGVRDRDPAVRLVFRYEHMYSKFVEYDSLSSCTGSLVPSSLAKDRGALRELVRDGNIPQKLAKRGRIVLMTADGQPRP